MVHEAGRKKGSCPQTSQMDSSPTGKSTSSELSVGLLGIWEKREVQRGHLFQGNKGNFGDLFEGT